MMLNDPSRKYSPFKALNLPDRQWPNRLQNKAPQWCSVDMRDGNQALIEPMDLARKRCFFQLLVEIGFKHIEVGFPAASQTDFDYVRELITQQLIPDDVTIQVMTQAREDLIERTFEALQGAPRAIVHVYNATAKVFREVVFGVDKQGCIDIAINATRQIKKLMQQAPQTDWTFQYSPETFCFTEPEFALQICSAVIDEMQPTAEHKMILNLPTTVEVASPNIFADQIEWFCRHIKQREAIIISIHPHNDRGTGTATAELAMLAGAERIEGTLFGNGERTGNLDIVNLALNLYSSGISPQLDFSNINHIMDKVEYCNQLPIHPRHPYAGELVFTAFSGSHQDAIKKGFAARAKQTDQQWQVPYLPIDPADLGRDYEAVIRVNSQSGKGGIAYLLEQHGIIIPRRLQIELSQLIQTLADTTGKEITSDMIVNCFQAEYLFAPTPYQLTRPAVTSQSDKTSITATLHKENKAISLEGQGNGPLAALVNALAAQGIQVDIADYHEHSSTNGASAEAYAYIEIVINENRLFGVGKDSSILNAGLKALICALNRAQRQQLIE